MQRYFVVLVLFFYFLFFLIYLFIICSYETPQLIESPRNKEIFCDKADLNSAS